jgi:hypothetical protein
MAEEIFTVTPDVLIKAKSKPDIVEVPARLVLAVSGSGGPGEPEFSAAVAALYGIAYALRGARKKAERPVFKVGALEAEWWVAGTDPPAHEAPDRSAWRWRLQMAVPADLTQDELAAAVEEAAAKRGGKLAGNEAVRRLQLLPLAAGRYARVLHVGPYATESESIAKIAQMLSAQGLAREPRHVEVYISDPNRTAPAKLKTVLLTPVRE